MKAYVIVDRDTGDRWSRNRWATPTAMPDLYATRANAQRQIDTGKISLMSYECNPEVVEVEVTGLD